MDLDPARGTRNVLTMILSAPALHKAHSNGAHLGEFVDGLEPLVDGLGQELSKLLIVENLQTASGRNLADGRWVEPVGVVTLPTLDKDGPVTQALCKDLSSNVEQVHPFADVATNVLDS